jgi:hypothetical protein
VGSVTERLGDGFSAGAEPDFLSGIQGHFDRLFGGDFRFHVFSWQLAVGSWQLAVGSWQLAVGS